MHCSFKTVTEGIVAGKKFTASQKLTLELNFGGDLFLQSWYNKDLAGVNKNEALRSTARHLVKLSSPKLKLKVL